jgi:hypothetical protein
MQLVQSHNKLAFRSPCLKMTGMPKLIKFFGEDRLALDSIFHKKCCMFILRVATLKKSSLHLILLQRFSEVPVIQIAASDLHISSALGIFLLLHRYSTHTKICSEAEPAQIWSKQPPTYRIDLTPDVGNIAHNSAKSKNVSCSSNWAAHGEVQRCPE